jgi:hypothetical protein
MDENSQDPCAFCFSNDLRFGNRFPVGSIPLHGYPIKLIDWPTCHERICPAGQGNDRKRLLRDMQLTIIFAVEALLVVVAFKGPEQGISLLLLL